MAPASTARCNGCKFVALLLVLQSFTINAYSFQLSTGLMLNESFVNIRRKFFEQMLQKAALFGITKDVIKIVTGASC